MTSEEIQDAVQSRIEVVVTGDTITYKKKLSSAGFRWDSARRGWVGIVRLEALSFLGNLDVRPLAPVAKKTMAAEYRDWSENPNSDL